LRPTHNPELEIIKINWRGNPLNHAGLYCNIDPSATKNFSDVLKWKRRPNKYAKAKKNQQSGIVVHEDGAFLEDKTDGITWLGHASFLMDFQGIRIITDPVLGKIQPLKRYSEFPVPSKSLTNIDYILLSHNHRDHCDKPSLKLLCRNNPQAVILTGLEMSKRLRPWRIKNKIIEAGWFQRYFSRPDLTIDFLPTKHWSRRYIKDSNRDLWGSFMINNGKQNIYFGGDSGMGSHYKMIKDLYVDIDMAIVGIGAYEPVWFMHESHTSPQDIVEIQGILGTKKILPMHYGTFDLSDEPVDYPPKVLKSITDNSVVYFYADIGKKYSLP